GATGRQRSQLMATHVADETTATGFANPMGTDGFEFVEYTAPDIELLRSLFTKMGFPEVARHKSKNVTLHKQADCNFIINAEPGSYAEEYAKAHGPSACAMAFRVKDAKAAHARALKLGAPNIEVSKGAGELDIPAIEGIGGSRLVFVDLYGASGSIYEVDFVFHPDWQLRVAAVDIIAARGIPFQDTPETYYELLPERIKGHEENVAELRKRGILMDGAPTEGQGLLLQIFTQNVIGPIFFEIIQRKGNEGFGEG